MHPASDSRDGRPVPSKIRDGKNRGVCDYGVTTTRPVAWGGWRGDYVSHERTRVSKSRHEMTRFSAHMPNVKCAVIYGGVNIKTQREELKANMPNVIVATPGRLKVLAQEGTINLKKCAHFILDEVR